MANVCPGEVQLSTFHCSVSRGQWRRLYKYTWQNQSELDIVYQFCMQIWRVKRKKEKERNRELFSKIFDLDQMRLAMYSRVKFNNCGKYLLLDHEVNLFIFLWKGIPNGNTDVICAHQWKHQQKSFELKCVQRFRIVFSHRWNTLRQRETKNLKNTKIEI